MDTPKIDVFVLLIKKKKKKKIVVDIFVNRVQYYQTQAPDTKSKS